MECSLNFYSVDPRRDMILKILLFPFKLLSWIYNLLMKFWRLYVVLNVLAVVLVVLAIWGFNFWFPKTAEIYVKHKTHFPLSIAQSDCSLLKGSFAFKGIDLKNPKEKFKQEYCVQLNQLAVDIDWIALLQAKLDVKKVVLDIDKIVCERGNDDKYNFTTLYKSLCDGKSNTTRSQIPQKPDNFNAAQNEASVIVNDTNDAKTVANAPKKTKVMTSGTAANPKNSVAVSKKEKNPQFIVNDPDNCFIVRTLEFRLGTCELYNVIRDREEKVNINKSWVFHNVVSKDQIINTIVRDLQGLGISIVVKNVIGTIFDLPVLNVVTDSVEKVHEAGKEMIKGVTSSLKEILPTKELVGNSLEQLKNAFSGSNSEEIDPSKINSDINDLLRSRRR